VLFSASATIIFNLERAAKQSATSFINTVQRAGVVLMWKMKVGVGVKPVVGNGWQKCAALSFISVRASRAFNINAHGKIRARQEKFLFYFQEQKTTGYV